MTHIFRAMSSTNYESSRSYLKAMGAGRKAQRKMVLADLCNDLNSVPEAYDGRRRKLTLENCLQTFTCMLW